MGAKIIYQYIFKPIYNVCGDDINYYVNRSHEQMYDFNKDVGKNLTKMKGVATDQALKLAMERHEQDVAEENAANETDTSEKRGNKN